MQEKKALVKGSFLKGLLRALGIDRDSGSSSPCPAGTQSGVSMSYLSHALKRTALQEAEQAKANGIMELRRKITL